MSTKKQQQQHEMARACFKANLPGLEQSKINEMARNAVWLAKLPDQGLKNACRSIINQHRDEQRRQKLRAAK